MDGRPATRSRGRGEVTFAPTMNNNEILRRIHAALALDEETVLRIFGHVQFEIEPAVATGIFREPETEGFVECPNATLAAFLDGLIIDRRGVNEKNPPPYAFSDERLDNSDVFKKLRIALDMYHVDVNTTLGRTGVNLSKSDLASYFRSKNHPQYRNCSDAVLRAFLTGYKPPRRPRIVR